MKYYIILTLVFVHSTLCNSNINVKAVKSKWKTITKLNCKSFKCPPVEDLLCVRLRSKKIGSKVKDIFMVLFNRCEMGYIKCNEDFQATEVSMKNCGQHYKILKRSEKERVKRDIIQETMVQPNLSLDDMMIKVIKSQSKIKSPLGLYQGIKIPRRDPSKSAENDNDDNQDANTPVEEDAELNKSKNKQDASQSSVENNSQEQEDPKVKMYNVAKSENDNQNSVLELQDNNESNANQDKDEINTEIETNKDDISDDINGKIGKDVYDKHTKEEKSKEAKQSEVDEDKELEKDEGNEQNERQEDNNSNENDVEIDKKDEGGNAKNVNESQENKDNLEDKSNNDVDAKKVLGNKDDKQANFLVDYDLKAANDGVDFNEYQKDCPTFCPAKEVMICARCRDGVYRTFMSICHLRMFNCNHPDEKAELISRNPCILSAPYLAEAPTPKGRVAEPGDIDQVLQYIRCREKNERGVNTLGSRCNFDYKKNNKNK